MTDLAHELCDLAARLAVAAGELVFEGRKNGLTSISTKSTDTDVVTEFDRASERLIVEGLHAERPDDAVVGEEGTDSAGASGIRWLIDPIDGTTNFQYDLPGYAVSIAALSEDGPLAGAVYIPSSRELFTATAGGGALLNGVAHSLRHDRPRCNTRWSPRASRTRSSGAASRPGGSPRSFRGFATSAGSGPPRRTSATSPRAARRVLRAVARPVGLGCGRADRPRGRMPNGTLRRRSDRPTGEVLAANPALFDQMVELLTVTEPGRNPGIM